MKIWRSPLPLTDKEGSRLNILSNMWTQNITKASILNHEETNIFRLKT